MEQQEQLTIQQFISERLNEAIQQSEASRFEEALGIIKEAKAADTKNIYLIAFEKQVAKLADSTLTDDGRSEILKSLNSMKDRAIADSQRRLAGKPADVQAQQVAREKEAALDKLKTQYFRRADDYIEKGDYQHALEEVRRIYIIDANNVVAKEYEQKIAQLASMKPTVVDGAPESAPAESPVRVPHVVPIEEEEEPKSKLPIFIGIAVVVIGVLIWLVLTKKSGEEPPVANNQSTEEAIPNLPNEAVVTPQTGETPVEDSAPIVIDAVTTEASKNPAAKNQKPTVSETKPTVQAPAPAAAQTTTKESTPAKPVQQMTPAQTAPAENKPQSNQNAAPAQTQSATQQTQQQETAREAVPRPFVAIESNPELVQLARPKYPEIAWRTGVEGRVVVEVVIDQQGKPVQAKVLKSSSSLFDEAAIEAAMKSAYKPAMMTNGPVSGKITIPINFRQR